MAVYNMRNHIIHIYSGITRDRVLNGELYTQPCTEPRRLERNSLQANANKLTSRIYV